MQDYKFLVVVAFLLLFSCQKEKTKENLKNIEKSNSKVVEIKGQVHEVYNWYENLLKNLYLTTSFKADADNGMYIENKTQYLSSLSDSNFFTLEFISKLSRFYDQCEIDINEELSNDHLTCLEIDVLTFDRRVREISKINFKNIHVNKGVADVSFTIYDSEGFSNDGEMSLNLENGKWLIDNTSFFDTLTH